MEIEVQKMEPELSILIILPAALMTCVLSPKISAVFSVLTSWSPINNMISQSTIINIFIYLLCLSYSLRWKLITCFTRQRSTFLKTVSVSSVKSEMCTFHETGVPSTWSEFVIVCQWLFCFYLSLFVCLLFGRYTGDNRGFGFVRFLVEAGKPDQSTTYTGIHNNIVQKSISV